MHIRSWSELTALQYGMTVIPIRCCYPPTASLPLLGVLQVSDRSRVTPPWSYPLKEWGKLSVTGDMTLLVTSVLQLFSGEKTLSVQVSHRWQITFPWEPFVKLLFSENTCQGQVTCGNICILNLLINVTCETFFSCPKSVSRWEKTVSDRRHVTLASWSDSVSDGYGWNDCDTSFLIYTLCEKTVTGDM